jgi:hypothetical protein
MMNRSFACVLALLVPSLALADDLAPPAATPELAPPMAAPDLPTVAITVSPVHLAIPMAEVTTEVRLADKLGIAAILGIGSFRDKASNMSVNLYEGGVSGRYYVLGSFRKGLQVGAEALYLKADTEASNIEVKAAGLSLAPFVGYKWTHRSGFTFDGQLGVAFMALRAEAETGQMASDDEIGPLLNLNVGYSF